jgi:hypothetical protein
VMEAGLHARLPLLVWVCATCSVPRLCCSGSVMYVLLWAAAYAFLLHD